MMFDVLAKRRPRAHVTQKLPREHRLEGFFETMIVVVFVAIEPILARLVHVLIVNVSRTLAAKLGNLKKAKSRRFWRARSRT